jgi:hypothetical protein
MRAKVLRHVVLWGAIMAFVFLAYAIMHNRDSAPPARDARSGMPSVPMLRRFPWPYRAALAVASDIDSCSREEFLEIHQFLNTKENTSQNAFGRKGGGMGVGVGLEFGDSFWFFSDYNSGGMTFSYFLPRTATPGPDADLIRSFAHAGYIDVMHSYGDISSPNYFTRSLAKVALAEMTRAHMRVSVFTDHGSFGNLNNISWPWNGDVPDAPQHHTDLSLAPRGPFRFVGDARYAFWPGGELLRPRTFRDGTRGYSFRRQRVFFREWNVDVLYKELSPSRLDGLIEKGAYCIYVNHFGLTKKGPDLFPVFNQEDVASLRDLERRHREGLIDVTTTSKLLWRYFILTHLDYAATGNARDGFTIAIRGVKEPIAGDFAPTMTQLESVTFYSPNPAKTRVLLGGVDVTHALRVNPPDASGCPSMSFPTRSLPPMPEWTSDGLTSKTEDYSIDDYQYRLAVENIGDRPWRPTLSYVGLHPFSIREAKSGSTYYIDVPNARQARLSPIAAGHRAADLEIVNGPYNPAIPRLLDPSPGHVTVKNAVFDATTSQTVIALEGRGARALRLEHCPTPFPGARSIIGSDGGQDLVVASVSGNDALRSVKMWVMPQAGSVEVNVDQWPDAPTSPMRWRESTQGPVVVARRVGGLPPRRSFRILKDGAFWMERQADRFGIVSLQCVVNGTVAFDLEPVTKNARPNS